MSKLMIFLLMQSLFSLLVLKVFLKRLKIYTFFCQNFVSDISCFKATNFLRLLLSRLPKLRKFQLRAHLSKSPGEGGGQLFRIKGVKNNTLRSRRCWHVDWDSNARPVGSLSTPDGGAAAADDLMMMNIVVGSGSREGRKGKGKEGKCC